MFKKLNEEGSLVLVMLVVMVIAMSIATLGSMLLTENINMAYSITTDMDKLYEMDSANEVTKNVIRQVFQDKMWTRIDGEKIVNSDDLNKIEEAVTNDILPDLDIDYSIQLEGLYYPPDLTHYCEEIVDINGTLLNFVCSNEVFDIELKLSLEKEGRLQTYIVVITNGRVYSDEMAKMVRMDLSESEIQLK